MRYSVYAAIWMACTVTATWGLKARPSASSSVRFARVFRLNTAPPVVWIKSPIMLAYRRLRMRAVGMAVSSRRTLKILFPRRCAVSQHGACGLSVRLAVRCRLPSLPSRKSNAVEARLPERSAVGQAGGLPACMRLPSPPQLVFWGWVSYIVTIVIIVRSEQCSHRFKMIKPGR